MGKVTKSYINPFTKELEDEFNKDNSNSIKGCL